VKTVGDKVVIHWPIYSCKNGWWGTSTWKFGRTDNLFKNAEFQSICS